jgi:transcriptional regulator with XRE-family HTH domain
MHPADLGGRLRALRLQHGLTLERLARAAEMSKSALSQIEGGRIDPSLQTLRRLATCLQTPLASLFETRSSIDQRVVRKGQRKVFRMPRNHLRYELLTPDLQNKRVEFLRVEFEADSYVTEEPYSHEGEEYGFVIQGRVEVHVDGTTYRLGPGDSIFFPAKLPHYVRGAGRRKAVMIWAISPPSY